MARMPSPRSQVCQCDKRVHVSDESEPGGLRNEEETMNSVRRCVAALLTALLMGWLVPGAAGAANGRTVYVDDNGTANAAGKGKCGEPNYTTIQAAVNDTSA